MTKPESECFENFTYNQLVLLNFPSFGIAVNLPSLIAMLSESQKPMIS